MISEKVATINEYIAGFPKETREILKQVRATIRNAAPGAEETISYAIPCFKLDGHYLIYFAGYKKHVSIYPAPRGNEKFKEVLAKYKGGKGTVQFPLDEPIPHELITRIVKFRLKEHQVMSIKPTKKQKS